MLIGANEICLCGSGKKFKKCCRNLIDYKQKLTLDNIDNISVKIAIEDAYKKVKKSKCLYPGCEEKAIDSHTIQKGGVLKLLAENDEICHNFINYNNYPFRKLTEDDINSNFVIHIGENLKVGDSCLTSNLEFFKEHINNVSIFNGFCNKHDTAVFKDIEFSSVKDITFSNRDKEVFLYCYRLFSYFYKREEVRIHILRNIFKSNINCFYNKKSICAIKADIEAFERLSIEKEYLDNCFRLDDFSIFESNHAVLNKRVHFCSMSILPLRYEDGKITLSYLFVIPEENKTHIYFCKKKENNDLENTMKNMLVPMNTVTLTNLILMGKTQIVVTPSKVGPIQENLNYCKLLFGSDFFFSNKELKLHVFENIDKSFGVDLFNL